MELDLFFADMTGDGLADLVQLANGRVEYWPHLGHGRFGDSVVMDGAPIFESDFEFDASRLRFTDLDGSGTADVLYLGRGEIRIWSNQAGNRLVEQASIRDLPYLDGIARADILDFLGDGSACLAWSSPLASDVGDPLRYLPLTPSDAPRRLATVENSVGARSTVTFSSSSAHYLRDRNAGRAWATRIPQHVPVVNSLVTEDLVRGVSATRRYEYHDGVFDRDERRFVGFRSVDQYQVERDADADPTVSACVRTWRHPGVPQTDPGTSRGYFAGPGDPRFSAPASTVPQGLSTHDYFEAHRQLAGAVVREEVYRLGFDGARGQVPFSVTHRAHEVVLRQTPQRGRWASFSGHQTQAITWNYEEDGADPRINHNLTVEVDALGQVLVDCDVAYPRAPSRVVSGTGQDALVVSASTSIYVSEETDARHQLAIPIETKHFNITGVAPAGDLFELDEVRAALLGALGNEVSFDAVVPAGAGPTARLISWDRFFYWNEARDDALSLGSVGSRVIAHHEEAAILPTTGVDPIFGARVDDALLRGEAMYTSADGYWWAPSPVRLVRTADEFDLPNGEREADGGRTHFGYDAEFAAMTEIRDQLGNRIRSEVDYHTMHVARVVDQNDNVTEIRHDPIGLILAATEFGAVAVGGPAERYGNRPIADYVPVASAPLAAVVADPGRYLQGMSMAQIVHDARWADDGLPPTVVTLVRDDLEDGGSPATPGRIGVSVGHVDGFGRVLQGKELDESGPALARDAAGTLIFDAEGTPTEALAAVRWRASAYLELDALVRPTAQYEPFFSTTPEYEPDPELQTFGRVTRLRLDALGRQVGQDNPDGTRTAVEHHPWHRADHDANDTVADSLYRTQRDTLPDADPEKIALVKSLAHAGTPTTTHFDPVGREVKVVELGEGGVELESSVEFDVGSDVAARIDGRGLGAARYVRDMTGRVLSAASIDAGNDLQLPDAMDRLIRAWDPRGIEQRIAYDGIGREVTRTTLSPGEPPAVITANVYGESAGLPNPEAVNVRGRLVQAFDQAGVVTILAYTPGGSVAAKQRQVRTDPSTVADWSTMSTGGLDARVFSSTFTYDGHDSIAEESLEDGIVRRYQRRPDGTTGQITVSTADGGLDNEIILVDSEVDARGQRLHREYGNGVVTTYGYDHDTRRLAQLRSVRGPLAPSGTPTVLQDITYHHDPVGNVTQSLDRAQQPGVVTPALRGLTVSSRRQFTYDAFYRLRRATGRIHRAFGQHDGRVSSGEAGHYHGTHVTPLNDLGQIERYERRYTYDLAGNLERVRHVGSTANWTNNFVVSATSNRRVATHDPGGAAITDPERRFDAAGNTIALDHVAAVEWNSDGRLSRIVIIDRSASGDPDDDEIYSYGADGIRVRKVNRRLLAGGVETTDTSYFGGCQLVRRSLGSAPARLVRWTSPISDKVERIAIVHQWEADTVATETDDIATKRIHYQLQDHLGSAAMEVDESGSLISYEEYFPFGGTAFAAGRSRREVDLKSYRYSGKERDDAAGLYYFEYRYYAPWIGGWLSPDPLGTADTLNLYEFVRNNPINLIDPNGLQSSASPIAIDPGVPKGLTSTQAMNRWNNRNAIQTGVRITGVRRARGAERAGGVTFIVTDFERLDPDFLARARQRSTENLAVAEALDEALSILEAFDPASALALPEPDAPPTGGGGTATDADPGATGQGTGDATAPPANDAPAPVTDSSASPARSGAGDEGDGTGAGEQGTGPGGGGTDPAGQGHGDTGTGTTEGDGEGEGTGNRTRPGAGGTGREPRPRPGGGGGGTGGGGGAASSDGLSGGVPGGTGTGTTPGGIPGGEAGGREGGVPGASGIGADSASAEGETGPISGTGDAPPPGASTSIDGSPDGTGTGTTSQPGTASGDGTATEEGGREGGGESGTGTSPNGEPRDETLVQRLTRYAGYWNLEFGGNEEESEGSGGGIPGGMGSNSGGTGWQIAFIGLSVVDAILTVISFGGIKAIGSGIKKALTSGLRALKAAIPAARAAISSAVRSGVERLAGLAARLRSSRAALRMSSSNALEGVERASTELLEAVSRRRSVTFVAEGSEELRYLDWIGAEANVGGETMTHILLRPNPSKAAVLEEFLHGTQHRLGVIARLGVNGAERHVKDFMIRHARMLGLGPEDVRRLAELRDLGL